MSEVITYPYYYLGKYFFYHSIEFPYDPVYNHFEVNLTIYGWSSEDVPEENPDIIEYITRTIRLGDWLSFIEFSPVNISIIDPNGNIISSTYNEIPNAFYLERDINDDGNLNKIITIKNPLDGEYTVQLIGTQNGAYSLISGSLTEHDTVIFNASKIPVSSKEVHEYVFFNWTALSGDKEGVRIQIDIDGDGEFDYDFYSDSELTQDEYMDAIKDEKGKSSIPGFSLLILIGAMFILIIIKKIRSF